VVHPLLRSAAQRQLGIITAVDARRAGYGHPEIRHLCASGAWHRLRRGIYISADDLVDAEQAGRRHQLDCMAVLLALARPTAPSATDRPRACGGFRGPGETTATSA
jgi:hypothetical protein